MGDNIWLGDRDAVRTPMQWTPDRNAGFSSCDPGRLYLPTIMDPVYGYQVTNVEASMSSPSSLLHWTRRMIEIRKQNPAFGLGSYTELPSSNPAVLAFLREARPGNGDDLVLCVHNFSRFAQPTELDLQRLQRPPPGRAHRRRPLPRHRRTAVSAHPRRPRLLLVPAAEGRRVEPRRTPGAGRFSPPRSGHASVTPRLPWSSGLPGHWEKDTTPCRKPPRQQGQQGQQGRTLSRTPHSPPSPHRLPSPLVRPVAGLLASLDPLLREWLPRQRWFAGKGRPISGFTLVAATELLPVDAKPGLLHLLVRAHQPLVPLQAATAHPADCYQLLIGVRETLPPRLAPALIGHLEEGPLAGRTVYEALHDPRPADVLLEALRTRARVGELRFEGDPRQRIRAGLVPRLVTSEQSNSSLVYGDTFILKLLRRIVPGTNPDLELPLALAREGCPRVPAPAGWMMADHASCDDSYVLGVLQPFLQGAADGWELALRELAKGEDFTAEARALGRATAEVHTALARALPTVTLGRGQVEPLVNGMTERLAAAVQAVPALRPYAPGLRAAFEALADLAAKGRAWTAQRIHGDLHLGQCLRSPGGEWSLVDFEGEPSKPLAERRIPHPVARDVAGMLRSFDYAARSHRPWAPTWAAGCRAAYCAGYAEVSGSDPRTDPVLLRAYETDKAVYEVVYEARHRPDWLPVPLAAIRRLAANDD